MEIKYYSGINTLVIILLYILRLPPQYETSWSFGFVYILYNKVTSHPGLAVRPSGVCSFGEVLVVRAAYCLEIRGGGGGG